MGLINPKPSEIDRFSCTILAVYRSHGIFHPGSVLRFSPNSVLGEVSRSQIEEPQKKVVDLYRRTHQRHLTVGLRLTFLGFLVRDA